MLIGPGISIWQQSPPSAVAFLLDTLGVTALTAFSFRKLRSGYAGALCRIRRSSDNAEQDISAGSDGWLNEASVTAFVGANSAFVTTMYDQSGNGAAYVQATAANQPQLVNAGVINRFNTRPSMVITAAQSLTTSGNLVFAGAAEVHMAAVAMRNGAGSFQNLWQTANSATTGIQISYNAAALQDWSAGDAIAYGKGYAATENPRFIVNGAANMTSNTKFAALARVGSTASSMTTNGAAATARVSTTATVPAITAAGIIGGSWDGNISETIVLDVLTNQQRTTLHADQRSAWGT